MISIDHEALLGGELLPVIEDFYTIQGEGHYAGRPAYFIRLAGCDVHCPWCDAKYTWNPKACALVDIHQVVDRVEQAGALTAIITGGEPLLYPMDGLTKALHERGMKVFLETSGTQPISGEFDWICLSPKRKKKPLEATLARADELKVVISTQEDFEWAEQNARSVSGECELFLQPEWSVRERVMPLMVDYVKKHPRWNISIQTHKYMEIP